MKIKKIFLAAVPFAIVSALLFADTSTTRLGLTKPSVGSTGWGVKWNTNADTIDAGVALIAGNNSFTVPQYFYDGSAGIPGLAFTNETTSGIRRSAAGVIRMVRLGTDWFSLISSGVEISSGTIVGPNGSATFPTYAFTNQASAGMFLPAVNTLGFSVNGSTRLALSTTETFMDSAGPIRMSDNGTLTSSFTATGCWIKGTTTNDDTASGFVGQYVSSSVVSFVNFPTSSQFGDLASISLTAGDWDVSGFIESTANGATVTDNMIGISVTSGNSTPTLGQARARFYPAGVNGGSSGSLPRVRMSLNATTTVYLKYFATYTVATPQAAGTISARRMR